jgi:hypothetical protein
VTKTAVSTLGSALEAATMGSFVAVRGPAVLQTHGGIAVLRLACPAVRMKAVAKQVPRAVMSMASALFRSL